MLNLKILVCSHNQNVENENSTFFPIQVGKELSDITLDMQGDNTGDNISSKNKNYCELTGMYWAWRNLDDYDYIGLCHYRRYFSFSSKGINRKPFFIIKEKELKSKKIVCGDVDSLMADCDVVLPRRLIFQKSLKRYYCKVHYTKDYNTLKEVVGELYPDYTAAFDHIMEHNNKVSSYNMFIMSKSEFKKYSEWLFDILFEVEARTDISTYDIYQARIYGYMAERLLNVYVYQNKLKVKYLPVLFTGKIRMKDRSPIYNIVSAFRKLHYALTPKN